MYVSHTRGETQTIIRAKTSININKDNIPVPTSRSRGVNSQRYYSKSKCCALQNELAWIPVGNAKRIIYYKMSYVLKDGRNTGNNVDVPRQYWNTDQDPATNHTSIPSAYLRTKKVAKLNKTSLQEKKLP